MDDQTRLQEIISRRNEIHSVCPTHPACPPDCNGPVLNTSQKNQRDIDEAFVSYFMRKTRFNR